MTRCGGEAAKPCMPGQRCLTHGLWDALGDQIASFLENVTLQEVLDGIPAEKQAARTSRPLFSQHPIGQPSSTRAGNEPATHISRLERDGAAAARGAGSHARGARRCRQSVLAACRGPAGPRRRRGCARAGRGAGRRQAGRGRLHQRRHGGQQRGAGRRLGRDPSVRHRARLRCWRRRAAPAPDSSTSRSGAMASCAARALCRPYDAARPSARCRCRWPTTRPARCSRLPRSPRWQREHGLAVHTDAVQAAGRVPIDMRRARRRLPDAVRPQARRTQGRGRAGRSRRRQPARLHRRRRPGAAAARGHRERRGHRRLRRGRRGGTARSCAKSTRFGPCATGWRQRLREITPEAVVIAGGGRAPPQHDELGARRAPAPRRWSSPSISRALP